MPKKKKTVAKKGQSTSVVARIQSGIKKMRGDADALLARLRKEATRFSHEQKRALDRVGGEVRRFRGDLEKLVKRTSTDLETRSKRLLSALEKDVEKRLEPVVTRLVGPSRKEIQNLSRRIHKLEQVLKQHSHAEPPAAPSPAPEPAPEPAPSVMPAPASEI